MELDSTDKECSAIPECNSCSIKVLLLLLMMGVLLESGDGGSSSGNANTDGSGDVKDWVTVPFPFVH